MVDLARKEVAATPVLLGPDGQPLRTQITERANPPARRKSFLATDLGSYFKGLTGLDYDDRLRARDPFSNHAWVYAGAMAIVNAASTAPYGVWRETPDAEDRRRRLAKQMGRVWTGPRAGKGRRAIHRHLRKSPLQRAFQKSAEQDWDHPLMDLLEAPNPLQQGSGQLLATTMLWIILRGECFWLLTDDDGRSPGGSEPTRVWPLSPDLFTPVYSKGSMGGELVKWTVKAPSYLPTWGGSGTTFQVELDDIIQFKQPNPNDPVRGMSRISAAAAGIELDLMVHSYNRALVKNRAVPEGIVLHPEQLSATERQEHESGWQELHEGPHNAGRTAFLYGGLKYMPLGLSPKDLQHLQTLQWDREETLAVLGAGLPSALGINTYETYASALVQDGGFWHKTVVPLLRLIETTLDGTLFYGLTDNVFGMFDLSGVDALRSGMSDKIDDAVKLCSAELHCPPRVAYETVGLEVPEYDGDDQAFTGPEPVAEEAQAAAPEEESTKRGLLPAGPALHSSPESCGHRCPQSLARPRVKASRRWQEWLDVQEPQEAAMRKAYRRWVLAERKATLARFDAHALGKRETEVPLHLILPDLRLSANALKLTTRPTYASSLDAIFTFTTAEIGIPTFAIDDERLLAFFDERERLFTQKVPQSLFDRLRTSLTTGIESDETIQQLRLRVAEAYDIAAGSSKSLTVARTESANFMNGVRDQMFRAQGIEGKEWATAQDENVRDDHKTFGAAGPQAQDFDFLALAKTNGGGGRLRHPGDTQGPAGQVVNCRCLILPAEV